MNIVKLQNDLKGAPDQALIGYVQNPNGQVPSYLALSELNRRKQMRDQASSNQSEGPQPSVAEQLVSESQPQMPQGIAGIPVSNVGNEEAYATGGIVAFEDGGNVQSYGDGRRVSSTDAYQLEQERAEKEREVLYANMQDAILGFTGTPSSWRYGLTGGHLGSRYKPVTPEAEAGYNKQLETQADKINRAKYPADIQSMLPPKRSLDGKEYRTRMDPSASSYTGGPSDPRQFSYVQNPTTESQNMPFGFSDLPLAEQRAILRDAQQNGYNSANLQLAGPDGKMNSSVLSVPPRGSGGIGGGNDAAPIRQPQGIEQLMFTPMKDRSSEFEITEEVDPRTAMEEYRGLIGENPFQAKAAAKLTAMEEANELYKTQFPYMALAEAGLAIAAGKSPNALSNIAEGGMKGISAYRAGQDKLRDVEDKIFNAQAKVAETQRAEDIAAAKYGVDSKQAAKAARNADKAKLLEYQMTRDFRNQTGSMEAQKGNISNALKLQEMADDRKYRKDMIDVQRDVGGKTPAEIQLIERYAAARGIPFDKAFEEVQLGKSEPKTDAAIGRELIKSDPSFLDDPKRLAQAVYNYKQAFSQTDYSGWGDPKAK